MTVMPAPGSQSTASVPSGFAGLLRGFVESADRHPARPALVAEGQELSYESLRSRARQIAAVIAQFQPKEYPLGAILAARSITAYAGILGILASGKGYVPLNPKFPIERSRRMLLRSGSRILIADSKGRVQLPKLLAEIEDPLTVLLPESRDVSDLAGVMPQHRFISSRELTCEGSYSLRTHVEPDATAYLLFTSGSSGEPKGVPISHANVCAYVGATCDHYPLNEHDRLSQEFDLTFDLSVHDMFVAWERGACLCCVPESDVMAPAKFIRDSRLTAWFSVPSIAGFLIKMRLLAPGSFPTLRYSLFCGEPLLAGYAQQWQEAAPNSIVENLYGPTETTIAITRYRWNSKSSPIECLNGIVPIGWPFECQQVSVAGEDLRLVPPGGRGELCLAGSQVASGYWNDPQRTALQFVRLQGQGDALWYRTGDLVEQRPDGCLRYVGRMDHQVKIRGYRVELQEIEEVLRMACGTEQVAALAWPVSSGNAEGVVAFVARAKHLELDQVLDRCRESLPDYMVPRKILPLDEMPLNANGKLDRKRLFEYLEKEGL
jgi:amino acid adenylation domain-containing protein